MQGIVAFVDLTQGAAAEEAIAAHMDAGAGRLRGGRHLIAWDDDVPTRAAGAGMLGTPAVRAAGRLLARHGLVFDATVFSRQLPELVEFARALPELTVVLDHFGMPLGVGRHAPRTEETWAHWRRDLVDLAGCPNVVVKIGGFGIPTIALPLPVTARPATAPGIVELWQATVDWLIDAFGPDRCMFESNFPVDRAVCSYRELWNAFKLLSRGLSPAERDAVLRRTAERTYDLAPLEPPP
jgi:predicted TIM-barrel fold metal-dependent hydrolase